MTPKQSIMMFALALATSRTAWLKFAPQMPTFSGELLTGPLTDTMFRIELSQKYSSLTRRGRSVLEKIAELDPAAATTQLQSSTEADRSTLSSISAAIHPIAVDYYGDAIILLAATRMSNAGKPAREKAAATAAATDMRRAIGEAFLVNWAAKPASAIDDTLAQIPWYDKNAATSARLAIRSDVLKLIANKVAAV